MSFKIRICQFLIALFIIGMTILNVTQLFAYCGYSFIAQSLACVLQLFPIGFLIFNDDENYTMLRLSFLLLECLFCSVTPIYQIFVVTSESLCGYEWCASWGNNKKFLEGFQQHYDYSCSDSFEAIYKKMNYYAQDLNYKNEINEYSVFNLELDEIPIIITLVILSIIGIVTSIIFLRKIIEAWKEKQDEKKRLEERRKEQEENKKKQLATSRYNETRQNPTNRANGDTGVVFIQVRHTQYLLIHDQENQE